MKTTTNYGNCLLFHGGGLCPDSNAYLSTLAEAIRDTEMFEQVFMGFYSFECLLNPDEFIRKWDSHLKAQAILSPGGFYGTDRTVNLAKKPELKQQAIHTCKELGITWVITAGGDGSCRQVDEISKAFEAEGIHFVIPMPLTIDGIEGGFSLGLRPAVNKSFEVLNDLSATNLQTRHERKFSVLVLETQGRNRDDILANLLMRLVAEERIGGIPHSEIDLFAIPANYCWDKDKLVEHVNSSTKRTLILKSEGASVSRKELKDLFCERKVRDAKVGYLSQMNTMVDKEEKLAIESCVNLAVHAIESGVKSGSSFSLVMEHENNVPSIEPINYFAIRNPRKGQVATLNGELELLLQRYTP